MTARDLPELLEQHLRNESHRTLKETRYWCGQYKLLAQRAIAALAGAGAVAFVPVHPKNGPLWGDTYPRGDAADGRSPNYERMPLFTHPAPVAVGVDEAMVLRAAKAAHEHRRRRTFMPAWEQMFEDYQNHLIDEARSVLTAALEAKPHA